MGKSPLLVVSVIVMAIACGVMGTLLLMRPTEVGRLPTPPTTIAPAPSLVLPDGASLQVKQPVDAPPPIVAAPAAAGAIAVLGVPPPVVAPPKHQPATDAAKVYTVRVIARASQGTGFAIAPNLIVTSHHIVGEDRFVTLTLHDKTSVKAEVIATEALTDCALIYTPRRIAGVAQVESSASTSVGTEVFVYGHPEGLDGTLSNGIISGLRSAADESLAAIQITAPISHGSSGSPLFLHDGKVIGLIQATITDGQNLNFALPIAKVLGSFANVMESWKKLGEVRTELALIEPGRDLTRIRALMGRVDSVAARINDSTLMNECRLIGWAHENVSSELSTIDLVGDLVKRVVAARLSSADGLLPEADLAVFKKELESLSKYGLRGPLLEHMDDSLVNTGIYEFTPIRTPDSVTALVADVRGSGGLKRDRLLAVYRDILSNQPQARDCLLFAHLLHPVEVEAAIGKGPIDETWTRALATQHTQPLCGSEYVSGPRVLSKCLGWLPIKDAKDYYLALDALNKRIVASHGNPVQALNELGFLQEFGIGTPIN